MATLLNGLAVSIIPFSKGSATTTVALLMAAHFLIGLSLQINEINMLSLRQSIAPSRLQGRINGSFRFVVLIADLFGALVVAMIGEVVALRKMIAIAALGLFLPFIRLLWSSVPKFRELSK